MAIPKDSIVDRLIEFVTADANSITCTIQFETQSADPSSSVTRELGIIRDRQLAAVFPPDPAVTHPPTNIQTRFVAGCRSFFRNKTMDEIMTAGQKSLLPKATCFPPGTIKVNCRVLIPSLPTQTSPDHDLVAYSSDNKRINLKFSIDNLDCKSLKDCIIDDLANKYVIFFWTQTFEQITSIIESNTIPMFPIDPTLAADETQYQLVITIPQ